MRKVRYQRGYTRAAKRAPRDKTDGDIPMEHNATPRTAFSSLAGLTYSSYFQLTANHRSYNVLRNGNLENDAGRHTDYYNRPQGLALKESHCGATGESSDSSLQSVISRDSHLISMHYLSFR